MKKANTAERYKQKLQATQDLQKQHEDVVEELNEVRQQFNVAEKARQQVAGLHSALDEYKRILPKIEQDRHDLQMMKKQLEFDNAALAERWESANEQHARDQESIADLADKLADYELSQGSTSIIREGLSSEINSGTKNETQLQVTSSLLTWTRLISLSRKAKVTELETEKQQLQAANALQASEKTAVQQLLEDMKERHEQRERKNLETYQEKLMLESALAAIKQGDPIQRYPIQSTAKNPHAHDFYSTEVFKKMRDQVSTEQKRSAELRAELTELKSQLQRVEKERMSTESRYRKTIELQSNALSGLLDDKRKRHSLGDEQAQIHNEKSVQRNTESSDQELTEILQQLKNATAGRLTQETEEGNKTLDHQISLMADKVINSKERLAKRAAVQQAILSSNSEPESLPRFPPSPRSPQSARSPQSPRFPQSALFPQTPRFPRSPRSSLSALPPLSTLFPEPAHPPHTPRFPQSPSFPQPTRKPNRVSWLSLI